MQFQLPPCGKQVVEELVVFHLDLDDAPLLFGRIYAWANAKPNRRTGLGFWVAALFALGAEAVHRRVDQVVEIQDFPDEKTKIS